MINTVAEPPKLSRLKCVNHHHKGNISLNALQTEQFFGLSGNVPIQPPVLGSNKHTPHEGESRDITTTILQHRHSKDYKPVQIIITKPNLENSYTSHKCKASGFKQRKIKHDGYNTSQKGYQASPSMVSLVKVIAGRRRIPLYRPARRQ